MKVKYLDTGEKKLISYYRHDYKEFENSQGQWFMIDGGQEDYIRFSAPEGFKIEEKELDELIEDIRLDFIWTQRYNKENSRLILEKRILLKDLEKDHIEGIIEYIGNPNNFIVAIMKAELKYRENGI